MNTYKQLKDFIATLPDGKADVFYRTESFKFLCDKIDQLEAMISQPQNKECDHLWDAVSSTEGDGRPKPLIGVCRFCGARMGSARLKL